MKKRYKKICFIIIISLQKKWAKQFYTPPKKLFCIIRVQKVKIDSGHRKTFWNSCLLKMYTFAIDYHDIFLCYCRWILRVRYGPKFCRDDLDLCGLDYLDLCVKRACQHHAPTMDDAITRTVTTFTLRFSIVRVKSLQMTRSVLIRRYTDERLENTTRNTRNWNGPVSRLLLCIIVCAHYIMS